MKNLLVVFVKFLSSRRPFLTKLPVLLLDLRRQPENGDRDVEVDRTTTVEPMVESAVNLGESGAEC